MSAPPTSPSPDLERLRQDGYELEIRDGVLLVHHVPYATTERTVRLGTLISTLTLAGDVTSRPDTHVVSFVGQTPCDRHGVPLARIINAEQRHPVAPGLEADFMFSSKPPEGYPDYYEKMSAYVAILTGPAQAVDPTVTATTFATQTATSDASVFEYAENSSTRSGIVAATEKLRVAAVAIVGLGGTGSYVLDLIAKTPVGEIHLFDGDVLSQHNAFRAPGAPTAEELQGRPLKVHYWQRRYAPMRRGILAHPEPVTEHNVEQLRGMDFVFLTLDNGPARRLIVAQLEVWDVAFVDVGMGLYERDGTIGGVVRTTTSTPGHRDHVHARNLIPFQAPADDDVYGENIQTADLNMLNAVQAVIRWKKHLGFYLDLEHEHHSVYTIDGNHQLNEHAA